MHGRPWTTVIALLVLWTSSAMGQGRDPAGAEAMFREGRKAADAGDWATACPRFAESQRLDPAPGTLINLADCEEHRGKVADAWQHWREALDTLDAKDDRLPRVKQRLAAAETRVPRLTIKLAASAPSGATILRDDVQLGTASVGVALPINPGKHVVVVRSAGRAERRYEAEAREGQSQELVVDAGPPLEEASPASREPGTRRAVATPSASKSRPHGSGGSSTVGWVVGGLGVAGLVFGGATGVMALGKKGVMDDHCAADGCDQDGIDAASSGKTLSTMSTVGVAAGAIGVGLGIYFLVSSSDGGSQTTVGTAPVPGGAALLWNTHY